MNDNQKTFITGLVGGTCLAISLHHIKGLINRIVEIFKSL